MLGIVLNSLYVLVALSLTILKRKFLYNPCLKDEETGTERLKGLSKITEMPQSVAEFDLFLFSSHLFIFPAPSTSLGVGAESFICFILGYIPRGYSRAWYAVGANKCLSTA